MKHSTLGQGVSVALLAGQMQMIAHGEISVGDILMPAASTPWGGVIKLTDTSRADFVRVGVALESSNTFGEPIKVIAF